MAEKDLDMSEIDITREAIECVAKAQLYRDDPVISLRKVITGKYTTKEMEQIYKHILSLPEFSEIKSETIKLEELTLVEDSIDTITLMYNKMLREAQFEKKYDTVIRILKEIQKLKAIENQETKFEIKITVDDYKREEK